MSETEQLKLNIIQSLDQADEKVLRMVQAILQIEQEYDFWEDLPDEVKNEVEEAIIEADKGLGKTHEEVMKEYKKYL
jgi:hypothetical protein